MNDTDKLPAVDPAGRADKTVSVQDMGLGDEFRRLWGIAKPAGPIAPADVDVAGIVRKQRREYFAGICPPEFLQKIDRTKIPNLAAWDEADKWNGEHPGLFVWSHETGKTKSRFLWRKFGQLHVEQGKSVLRVTGLNLAEEYHEAFNRNKTAEFYGHFMRLGAVMFDDLDKMPLPQVDDGYAQQANGDRNARMLRELLDKFYEYHTPVLVTANESMEWFAERIGPSGERRLRAVCREIKF